MDLTIKMNKKEVEEVIRMFLQSKNLNVASVKFDIGNEYPDRPGSSPVTAFAGVTATITKF